MLIHFSVNNWACFSGDAAISMVATKERRQGESLSKWGRNRFLPLAAIYGGNAAGKTSFIRALMFMKDLVVRDLGQQGYIPVQSCRTSKKTVHAPTTFSIDVLAEENIYRFSFCLTSNAILEEKLEQMDSRRGNARIIYHRLKDDVELANNVSQQLALAKAALVPTRLFLSIASQLNAKEVLSVFTWFSKTLLILTPDTNWMHLDALCTGAYAEKTTRFLNRFAAGIQSIGLQDEEMKNLPFNERELEEISLQVGREGALLLRGNRDLYEFTRASDGSLRARSFVFKHTTTDGETIDMPMVMESDGTLRMLDLIPALQMLDAENRVVIIDELERSLHPHVCRAMVEDFLATRTPDARSQMLFTTHNLQLIGDRTLRRDEYWIVDKDSSPDSAVYSFSDFVEARTDSDLLRSYSEGRMGGIPRGF